jgi:hypothetical protein
MDYFYVHWSNAAHTCKGGEAYPGEVEGLSFHEPEWKKRLTFKRNYSMTTNQYDAIIGGASGRNAINLKVILQQQEKNKTGAHWIASFIFGKP